MAFFSRVSFRRRDRELAAAAGIVLAAAALLLTLVGNMISDNQKTMIQMQSGQLRSISESVAKQIEVFADEMASDLEMETKLNQFIEAERSLEQGQQEPMAQLLEEFLEGREGSVEGMAWESRRPEDRMLGRRAGTSDSSDSQLYDRGERGSGSLYSAG